MNQQIAREIKQEILAKVKSGERVADVIEQYTVTTKTIYGWLSQNTGENVSLTHALLIEVEENQCPYHLTEREWEIARMIIQGHSTKQIALALYIVVGTVRNHLKKIYRKLEVSSRVQLSNKLAQYMDLEQSDLVYK